MSRSKHGKIDGQFVPVLATTMDSPAWKAMSHGAKVLFVNLKRKVPRDTNRAYLSYRDAGEALGNTREKIGEWFAELEHYGFTVLHQQGRLGVDGKGKAPHWRLTELGHIKGADGLPEYPTRDFLSWDGVLFDPKPFRRSRKWDYEKQNPVMHVPDTPSGTSLPPPSGTSLTPQTESGRHVPAIEGEGSGRHVTAISSLTTTVEESGPASEPPSAPPLPPSGGSLEEETKIGLSKEANNVIHLDPRIAALEAVEKRRKLR